MRVVNECRIDFQYRLSPNSPIVIKTINSNIVSTDIVRSILKIEKYVDRKSTNAFDVLTYTVDIFNISELLVTNVVFQDKIPIGTRFIENSVTINNLKRRCINPQEGFYIGNINVDHKIRITFKVVVLPKCFTRVIKNYSTIEYDYIYNIEKSPTRILIESNKVNVAYENKVFKQLSINNSLKLYKPVYNILNSKVSIKVLEVKITNTPINDFYKNSNLCTIIIIGSIGYEVLYKSNVKNKFKKSKVREIISATDNFGFSSQMLVPVGITYLNKNNINIIIENVSTNLLDSETVFINTNILLYY